MCIPNVIGWCMAGVMFVLFMCGVHWALEYKWKKTFLFLLIFTGFALFVGFIMAAVKLIQYQC